MKPKFLVKKFCKLFSLKTYFNKKMRLIFKSIDSKTFSFKKNDFEAFSEISITSFAVKVAVNSDPATPPLHIS